MANLKSSKKDIRRTKKRTQERKAFKRNALVLVKKVLKLVSLKEHHKANEVLPLAYKAIDKAAKKNIFHRNKAARLKSNIAKAVSVENS